MSHHSSTFNCTTDRWSGFERVRTDNGQTGFFEGREFRSFLQLSLAASASITLRVIAPCEFILSGQGLYCNSGILTYNVVTGGTPTGTWSSALPVIGKNRMTERRFPYYEPQLTLATGGTVSGGTLVETVTVASGATGSHQATVGASMDDSRGLPAATYYLTFNNPDTGTSIGLYNLWWEERARHPSWKIDNLRG